VSSFVNVYNQTNTASRFDNFTVPTTTEFIVDTKTVTISGIHKIVLAGDLTATTGVVLLQIKKNGVLEKSIPVVSGQSIATEYSVLAQIGDIITVTEEVTAEYDINKYWYDVEENFVTTMDVDDSYYVIAFEDLIGNTTRIEFVKDVMKRFNLSFRKTPHSDNIEFITSKALINGEEGTEDWTDKLDSTTTETYTSGYAQDNVFSYNYDDSENDFADGNLLINNINLPTRKEAINTIFKATRLAGDIYSMNYWDEDNVATQDGLRIFKKTMLTKTLDLKFDASSNYVSQDLSVAMLDFSALYFQVEITNNYTEFTSLLDNYKKIVVNCNLSIIDVYNLDFFKLKYFKQLGRSYYLNKVKSYKNNTITKIELIQIPI
jgi:hypothetical protein